MSTFDEAATEALEIVTPYEPPVEVVIVQPKNSITSRLGVLLGEILAIFVSATIFMVAASQISFMPNFGYWESFWIAVAVDALFIRTTHINHWTRPWAERGAAS